MKANVVVEKIDENDLGINVSDFNSKKEYGPAGI